MRQKGFAQIVLILILAMVGSLGYVAYMKGYINPSLLGITPISQTPQITDEPLAEPDSTSDWKVYTNKTFNISFKYPNDWKGPEIYEFKNGFYFEIGTDTVYPYGTDRLDRKYTKENSYYIGLQYNERPDNISIEQWKENQIWIKELLPLFSMKDGEIKSGIRDEIIRVRALGIKGYKGVEYITSLSDTAQTERTYTRQVFLINDNYDTLTLFGIPNNVSITAEDTKNWKSYYKQVDNNYLSVFRNFANSISF